MLNAAVAAAYYLRIVAVMYFRTPLATPRAQGGAGAWWAAVASALLLVGIGVYPGPLMRRRNGQAAVAWRSVGQCESPQDGGFRNAGRRREQKKSRHSSLPRDLEWRQQKRSLTTTSPAPPALLLSRIAVTTSCHSTAN